MTNQEHLAVDASTRVQNPRRANDSDRLINVNGMSHEFLHRIHHTEHDPNNPGSVVYIGDTDAILRARRENRVAETLGAVKR